MKIYRGPSEKDFSEETHPLVSKKDLSKDTNAWNTSKTFQVNITKDGYERRADAYVQLAAEDILALHTGLVEGLQNEAGECQLIREKEKLLRKALQDISRTITLMSPHGKSESEALAEIKARVAAALKPTEK